MRALFSYGIALVILLFAGVWLATGTLVMGGSGPGEGEKPIISIIEGEEHGPIATQLANAGVLAQHEPSTELDPHMTIAQRTEGEHGADAALQSVRTSTYVAQPFSIEVPLRGRTQAKASVGAVAETSGVVDTVHVTKGQNVAAGDLLCTLDQGTRAAAVAQAKAGMAQAEAALQQAQADFDTNAELRGKGLAAANTARSVEVALSSAKAGVTSAEASLENAQAELDRTEIKAKVSGVVQAPLADAGAMLAQGAPCASIAPASASGACTTPDTLALISVRSSSAWAFSRDASAEVTPALAELSATSTLRAVLAAARPLPRSSALVSKSACACCSAASACAMPALAWATAAARVPWSSVHSRSPAATFWPLVTCTVSTTPEVSATAPTEALAWVRPRSGTSMLKGCAT